MEDAPKKNRSRLTMRLLLAGAVVVVLLGGALALVLYLRSPQFSELVRQKVVVSIEDASGGRVELGAFQWNLRQLEFEASNLTVHGLEPATAAPLARVEKVRVRAHIISLLQKRIAFTYLELDHPQINLIIGPDGKTNLPEPKEKNTSDPVQQLFDLAIRRAELRNGEVQVNDRRLPLDFAANDITLATKFDRRDRRYDGRLSVGKVDAKYQDYRDLPLAGEAEFSLWPTRVQVKRLKLESQNSHLELSGTLDNFSNPETQFTYAAKIDLPQAAAVARVNGIRKGTAAIDGSGSFAPGRYEVSGKVSADGVEDVATGLQLRDAALKGDFRADNTGFKLNNMSGRILGGQVTGKAEARKGAAEHGSAELKLAGVSVAEVARLLSSPSMQLEKLKPAGTVDGGVNLTWKGSVSRGIADFDLRVTPPAQAAPDQLALSGVARGSYDLNSGFVDLRPLQLSTQGTQIDASGRIGSRSASLNTSLQTTSLGEIDNILNALGQPALPMQLAGQASFRGTISGALRSPEIAGAVKANQFSYVYTPSPSANSGSPPPQTIHIDSFSGEVAYSQAKVALDHAVVQSSAMTLNVDGWAALENGNFGEQSAFDLHAVMHNGDVASVQKMLGTDYPLTGEANVTLQASGTKATPHGHGSFSLSKATVNGRPVHSLSGEVSLQGQEVKLTNAVLKAPGGTVFGSGEYNLTSRQMIADVHSEDIQLAHVPELQLDKLSTEGVANFKLHAAGAPQNPAIDAHLRVDRLVLNQEHVGALTLDAVTHGEQMVITGRSNFEHAVLTVDGTVGMHDNLPGTIEVQFRDLDIDPFLSEEIKGQITGHSAVAGNVHVTGPFRFPKELSGGLKIESFHVEVAKIPVQTAAPIEVALANGSLDVKSFALRSADTELKVGGSVQLAGARELQLQANGSVNMALMQGLNPDLTSSGKATVNVQVGGTMAEPFITGSVQVANVSVSDIDLPAALSDMNGDLVFNQSRLEIKKMVGHVGGGTVEFGGHIGYANGLTFNMTSTGSDIRFRYSGLSVTANQDLKVQGTARSATISGDITITRFAQIPSGDLAAAFANTSAPVPNATSPLNALHLDIHVRSAPELTIQTTLAKLSADADLRLKGTALNPVLLGRVNVAQGDFKINGQKYYLERGDLTFANPVRVDPVLDVEAKTRVRDFDITIGLHGTLERLSTTYRSDPPLSSEDIISLLTLGRTQQDYNQAAGSGGANLGEATGNAVIGAAINQLVSNRVSRLFGVSAIRINPAAGGPDNNPNARLTVEQQVSSSVTITYITNLARSAQQVLEFEYNVTRDYTITAIRDENGVVSFDLLIRKRKK